MQRNATFIHPLDDDDVIAGQGTLGLELLKQNQALDVVVMPVGGGGLIGGVGCAVKGWNPQVKVGGVQTSRLPSMKAALDYGGPVNLPAHSTLADGIARRMARPRSLPFVPAHAQRRVTADEVGTPAATL